MKQKLFFETSNENDNPDKTDKVKRKNKPNNQYMELKRIHYYSFQRC